MTATPVSPAPASAAGSSPSAPTTTPSIFLKTPYWDGDYWVETYLENGIVKEYRVLRKWVDKYPDLYGPAACDPDEGNGEAELDDYISRVLNKYTGAGGTFSTWSERHAFITGTSIGYLDVAATADIPPVPRFWITEGHYWLTGLMMGRGARKVEQAAPGIKTYLISFAAGGVSIAGVLKLFGLGG